MKKIKKVLRLVEHYEPVHRSFLSVEIFKDGSGGISYENDMGEPVEIYGWDSTEEMKAVCNSIIKKYSGEKSKKLKKSDIDFEVKIGVELECYVCGEEFQYLGDTKKEILKEMKERGFKYLYSEYFAAQGLWCGCDYNDEDV